MYTVISLLLLFLIAVASILLFFKLKNQRKEDLANGKCPSCKESFTTFKDENTGTVFRNDIIKSRLLKNHGCSGTIEVEYTCSNCGLKEVHTITNQGGCSL